MSIFGAMIPSTTIENAALSTLKTWIDTYLAEVERQVSYPGGAGTIQRPRSYQAAYDFDNWPEGQIPTMIVVCPGTAQSFSREGTGQYDGRFEVVAGCLVEDTTEANARTVTNLYQAAIEGVLVQHGALGGIASASVLLSREMTLPDVENRTLALARSTFHVDVDGVLTKYGGPATVPVDPYGPAANDPTITSVDVTLTPLP